MPDGNMGNMNKSSSMTNFVKRFLFIGIPLGVLCSLLAVIYAYILTPSTSGKIIVIFAAFGAGLGIGVGFLISLFWNSRP